MRHDRIDPGMRDQSPIDWSARVDRVAERMTSDLVTVRPDASTEEAWMAMCARGVRHLPVVDAGGRLLGIVTGGDLRRLFFASRTRGEPRARGEVKVADVMTRPVVTVAGETPIADAARLMHELRIGALPVMVQDRVVGILTRSDILGAFVNAGSQSRRWRPAAAGGGAA